MCTREDPKPTNIEHDNFGIDHTFQEVDMGAPYSWPVPLKEDVEMGSKQIVNFQQASKTFYIPDSLFDDDKPDDNHDSEVGEDDEMEGRSEVNPTVKVQAIPQKTIITVDDYGDRDVCTEQLTSLINDVFDGQDSSKSLLAYCLDAQRAQWKYAIRHPGQ